VIFEKGTVDVTAELVERPWRSLDAEQPASEEDRRYMMVWIVERK